MLNLRENEQITLSNFEVKVFSILVRTRTWNCIPKYSLNMEIQINWRTVIESTKDLFAISILSCGLFNLPDHSHVTFLGKIKSYQFNGTKRFVTASAIDLYGQSVNMVFFGKWFDELQRMEKQDLLEKFILLKDARIKYFQSIPQINVGEKTENFDTKLQFLEKDSKEIVKYLKQSETCKNKLINIEELDNLQKEQKKYFLKQICQNILNTLPTLDINDSGESQLFTNLSETLTLIQKFLASEQQVP